VQTGYEEVRSSVTLEIDDQADFGLAKDLTEQTMRAVPTVLPEPSPQALLSAIGSATVTLELRFWSGARQMETRQAQHDVIVAVLAALREAGVATGSDVLVLDAAPRLRSALEGRPG
jgi:small conductance mechanosensitive channel